MVKTKKKAPPEFEIILGDCINELCNRAKANAALAICDPPYNFGMDYDACDDSKSVEAYRRWTRNWLAAVAEATHRHGAIWIFTPDEWVADIEMISRDLKLHKRRHVVWGFGFGVACQKNFSRSHCHLLYLTRTKTKYTFNDTAIRVPSDRQLIYGDKRANTGGKLPNATWLLTRQQIDAAVPADSGLWYVSRICGTFKERKRHSPNQIPVPIMERIILSTSNHNDLVLDPFAGTGSAGVAAVRNGRRYLGYDISDTCVKQSRARIESEAVCGPS